MSPVATLLCVSSRSIAQGNSHLANHTLPTLFSVLTNYYSSWLVCSAGLPGNTYLFCMVLESTPAEHLRIDSVVRPLGARPRYQHFSGVIWVDGTIKGKLEEPGFICRMLVTFAHFGFGSCLNAAILRNGRMVE
jgi:hypothetical protein